MKLLDGIDRIFVWPFSDMTMDDLYVNSGTVIPACAIWLRLNLHFIKQKQGNFWDSNYDDSKARLTDYCNGKNTRSDGNNARSAPGTWPHSLILYADQYAV